MVDERIVDARLSMRRGGIQPGQYVSQFPINNNSMDLFVSITLSNTQKTAKFETKLKVSASECLILRTESSGYRFFGVRKTLKAKIDVFHCSVKLPLME